MEIQSPKNHGVEKKRKEKNVKWHLPGDEEQYGELLQLDWACLFYKTNNAKRLENGNGSQTLPLHSQRFAVLLGTPPLTGSIDCHQIKEGGKEHNNGAGLKRTKLEN